MIGKILRKLLIVLEAAIVFAGAFLLNVHLLGKQDMLPGGHPPAPTHSEHELVVAGAAAEEPSENTESAANGLVSLPAPFTADEVDRLARELFAERERLRSESDALSRERRDLDRISRDLRSRRDAFRERVRRAPTATASPVAKEPQEADPRGMAQIFDKMRAEAAAERLAAMDADLAAAVLGRMQSKQAAKALGAMDAKQAATLAAKIPSRKKKSAERKGS